MAAEKRDWNWLVAFKGCVPHSVYSDDCSLDDKTYIMTNPEETMGHPFLPSDAPFSIEEEAQRVVDMSKERPHPRKPVLAIVRGMGGGKTRLLEELRRQLLVQRKVLCLFITFNGHWVIRKETEAWPRCESPSMLYALLSITRMASVFYGLDIDVVVKKLQTCNLKSGAEADAADAIRSFLSHVIAHASQVRSERQQPELCHLVVGVDEAYEAERIVSTRFGCDVTQVDVTSCLRVAVLDKSLALPSTLVISSLSLTSLGVPLSTRPVQPLSVPSFIRPELIVSHWWRGEDRFCAEDIPKLLVVAQALCRLPRAVESAASFLTLHGPKEKSANVCMDQAFTKALFASVGEAIALRYQSLNFPSIQMLKALVFSEQIPVTDVMQLIRTSFFTNVLSNFGANMQIKPEGSVALLCAVAKNTDDSVVEFRDIRTQLMFDDLVLKTHGDALQHFLVKAILLRLAVAIASKSPLSLQTLLCLDDIADVAGEPGEIV